MCVRACVCACMSYVMMCVGGTNSEPAYITYYINLYSQPTVPVAASISVASQEIQQELTQLKSDHSQLQVKHKEVSVII